MTLSFAATCSPEGNGCAPQGDWDRPPTRCRASCAGALQIPKFASSLRRHPMTLELQVRRDSALCGLVGCLTACGSNPTLVLPDGDRTIDAGSGIEQDGKSPTTPDA